MGKCYVKCLIVDDYEEVIECVVVKEVFIKIEIVFIIFLVVEECIVKKEGVKKFFVF